MISLWAALLLASQVLAAEPKPVTVTLDAERIIHDGARKLTTAEGNAELVASNAAMHADQITWDETAQGATASGHVTLRLAKNGLLAVVADVVSVRVQGDEVQEIFIYDGLVMRKKGTTPAALLAARTQDEVRAIGGTTMTMTTSHMQKESDGSWRIDELSFTPCDCDFERPAWKITSSKTSVNFEHERVSMFGAVVRVRDVPVLWFPWLSLPLADRQTGLLVPKPTFTALNGFSIEQPVFITFGRSADLTLTPGYFVGTGDTYLNGKQLGQAPFGIRGPRLLVEFRHTPQVDNSGRVTIGALYDTKLLRDPINPNLFSPTVMRGPRFDATWQHAQTIGGGWGHRADMQLLSDGYLQRDLVTDVLARENGYLRSSLSVFHRGEDHYFGVDIVLRQDVTTGYPVWWGPTANDMPASGFAEPKYGPNPLQRLPGVVLAVPEKKLIGPFSASIRAEYARIAPTFGGTGDEGTLANQGFATAGGSAITPECLAQRLYNVLPNAGLCPVGMDLTTGKQFQGDRIFQPGEREARDRLDVMPTINATGSLGKVVTGSAFAAWRQDVWIGELTGTPGYRGYALVGGRADTEIARTFGTDWRHALSPSVELRGVPVAVGEQPAPYDAIDAAIPTVGQQLQGRVMLKQRLQNKTNGTVRDVLSLELGQGYDFLQARLSESWAKLTGSWWLARASVTARVDPTPRDALGQRAGPRLNRLSASAAIDDGRGRGFFFSYEQLIDEGTDRARAPYDLFFAGAPINPTQGTPQILQGGVRWRIGGFGLRYDIMFLQQSLGDEVSLTGTPTFLLAQHTVGASYGPACDCWRLELFATQRTDGLIHPSPHYRFPDVGATLTISGFGNIGSGQ